MSENFAPELLAQVVLIQKSIEGVKDASTRFWTPDPKPPYPRFVSRIQRIVRTPQQKGLPIKTRVYTVTMRILAGPAAAGYDGQNEDKLNALYDLVLDEFDARPKLHHPATGKPLRYVERAEILDTTGTIGFQYSDTTAPFFGTDFILQVTANFQIERKV